MVDAAALEALPSLLRARGYRVVGPVERGGAIVLDELASWDDLPRGTTVELGPGAYRLRKRPDEALFGYVVGPQSAKTWLHPPAVLEFRAERSRGRVTVVAEPADPSPVALVGLRPCDLAAIRVHDHVLGDGPVADPRYRSHRGAAFLIVVDCAEPAATCFCASMGTGPSATGGFDLALNELLDEDGHRFVIEAATDAGAEVLGALATRPVPLDDEVRVEAAHERARMAMGRRLDPGRARDVLRNAVESPAWSEVGDACLGCANCTMVCPTCFCTTVEDVTDLTGDHAERWRRWDSCFTFQFSRLSSGPVRTSTAARYRHWLRHKLETWHEQFGESGCVGCGRCITWCPVGIDLTEEVARLESATPESGDVA